MGRRPARLICLRDHLLFGQVTYRQVVENKNAIQCAQGGFRRSSKTACFQCLLFQADGANMLKAVELRGSVGILRLHFYLHSGGASLDLLAHQRAFGEIKNQGAIPAVEPPHEHAKSSDLSVKLRGRATI
jgi:hypothetical protein